MNDKKNIRSYSTPKTAYDIDLYLNSNEGLFLGSNSILSCIEAKSVSRYTSGSELEKKIADYIAVEPDRVVLTAGGDDAIERLIRLCLDPNKEAVIPVPTFEMIEIYAERAGAKLIKLPWMGNKYPTQKVIDSINSRTGIVCVVSPNNPTGACIEKEDLIKIANKAKWVGGDGKGGVQTGAQGTARSAEQGTGPIILLDLAYTKFAEEDLTQTGLNFDNVVMIRTFSKAWGLAGLRVGYALGPKTIIDRMRKIGLPYPVSSASMQVASISMDQYMDKVKNFVTKVKEQRDSLQELLGRYNIEYFSSSANFVLAKFERSEQVFNSMASMGVLVRKFPDDDVLNGWLRITLPGDDDGYKKLVNVLQTALRPEAILFDLDNTLVDTSTSYDQSIIATCKTYGVDIKAVKIVEARNVFGLNNDWELTFKLLQDSGVKASLQEITERFEGFYQGTIDKKGFKETERLIIDVKVLERLSSQYKLGVITGRPRKDAIFFLEKNNIIKYFGSVVTMDDTDQKPSPKPAYMLLNNLGVKTAWMIGDNTDDIRCAKAAGILPVGVLSRQSFREQTRAALYETGAAFVLEDINKIEEIIL